MGDTALNTVEVVGDAAIIAIEVVALPVAVSATIVGSLIDLFD